MSSEPSAVTAPQPLHPASLLFGLGSAARRMLLPGLIVLVVSRARTFELWFMLLFVPSAVASVLRYLTTRYHFTQDQLVIRSGLIFHSERHVRSARIQNLDLVQNPLHRYLGVADVRVETAGASQPEAVMSVLSLEAVDQMRRRIFAMKREPAPDAPELRSETGAPLYRMPLADVVLYGLLNNRGGVVLGAMLGLLWEAGVVNPWGSDWTMRGVFTRLIPSNLGSSSPVKATIIVIGLVLGLLLLMRILSVLWSLMKLYGFNLSVQGDDLRVSSGLLTRETATVPRQRIQALTLSSSLLQRLFERSSMRVATAGGFDEQSAGVARQWLAPLVDKADVPGLLTRILPDVELERIHWHQVSPRGGVRLLKRNVLFSVLAAVIISLNIGWWGLATLAFTVPWSWMAATLSIMRMGYALTPEAVLFRSGWMTHRMTIVRLSRVQVVTLHESPFDRRAGMARVAVDTAGGGRSGHSVHIPFLDYKIGRSLYGHLGLQAAVTAFRW